MSLVFDQYSARLRAKRAAPGTIAQFSRISADLDKWLAAQGVSAEEATYELLELYFDTLPYAPSTVGAYMRYVQAAYNFAAKLGRLRTNPAINLVPPKPDTKEPRVIPTQELRAIRDGITPTRDWLFFHLLAYTGMRRAEIRTLVWDDGRERGNVLRLEDLTIRVIGKGDKLRYVPVHPVLAEELAKERRDPGRSVLPSDSRWPAEQTIQDMSRRLHPVYTPHDFRRTVATNLDRNGVRESVIDAIMGWAPQSVRNRFYRNVAGPELQQAILRLYRDDPL